MKSLSEAAREIAAETLRQVDVRRVVQRHIAFDGSVLTLGGVAVPVEELDGIVIVAVGKAALPMYEGVCDVLQDKRSLPIRAVVVTNQAGATVDAWVIWGSHPLPDEHSFAAVDAALSLLATVTARTAVLFLISGGASAMIEAPRDPLITVGGYGGVLPGADRLWAADRGDECAPQTLLRSEGGQACGVCGRSSDSVHDADFGCTRAPAGCHWVGAVIAGFDDAGGLPAAVATRGNAAGESGGILCRADVC